MNILIKNLLSFILPITVLIIVPLYIEPNKSVCSIPALLLGLVFICTGMFVMVLTVSMFIRKGVGTLAPWSPPQKLVTGGIYAHVRNPMIMGVLIVLIGESIAILSLPIFKWAILFFIVNNIYFFIYEEPDLDKRFGDNYREYKKHVPRWIPKVKPFIAPDK
jgi:protein-S-isoprenylcysteine O-methyltransferase Ste14